MTACFHVLSDDVAAGMHTIPSVTLATVIARYLLFFIIIEAFCGVVNFAPNEKKES